MIEARKATVGIRRGAIVTALIILPIVLAAGVFFARRPGSDPRIYGNDFSVYYFAAREMLEGRDPYQNSIGEWTPYLYTPLVAEIIAPIALLPIQAAAYLWFLISAGAVGAAAWMLVRLSGDNEPSPVLTESFSGGFAAAIALIVTARFVIDTFYMGQVNTVVMMLSLAHVYLYSKNRKTTAALMIALAATMKVTPAILVFYHLGRMRFKYSAACFALIGLVTLLSFAPLGGGAVSAARTFVNRTITNGQGFDLKYSGNQSLRGFELRLTGESGQSTSSTSGPFTLLVSLALVGAALAVSSRGLSELASAAPFFCLAVILSPLSWKDHYVILIPAIGALGLRFLNAGTRRAKLITGGALVVCFALFNVTSWRIIGFPGAELADSHSLVFAGAVLVFVSCFRRQSMNVEAPKV